MELGIRPIIFKNDANNIILVLGGDRLQSDQEQQTNDSYRPAFKLLLEDST